MRFPTAHGIKRTGLCRVGGQHLSAAPNEPTFTEAELLQGDKDRAEFSAQRQVDAAHQDEVHRLRCIGGL